MTTDDLIESFAIRAALGNNGGTWTTHYTEAQKEHWRRFVRNMIVHIRIGIINELHPVLTGHWRCGLRSRKAISSDAVLSSAIAAVLMALITSGPIVTGN
jgi:hypothetical protein